MPKVSYLLF